MTFVTHRLIELHGNEDWDAWAGRWWAHVDAITDLWWVNSKKLSELRRERPARGLDWGAYLVELSKEDVLSVIPAPDQVSGEGSSSLMQAELVRGLPAGRYGVIEIDECEPHVSPGMRFTSQPDAAIPPFLPD